ncbi:hypothetical protein FHR70_003720 [Microvirga lupini]|uniref:Uncharacterized protein n=1 Tax=Microvirga lupini TaxID=420324 RepID=A0A7W4VNV6_9HYPH|nr:hypothetical protein [Microvirga lupini]MBB3020634.1 hypothetical protein [Microvirga lupini]
MSQPTLGQWGLHPTGPGSGAQVAARANATFNALLSEHSGATEPIYKVVGTTWADTSAAGKITRKYWTGSAWRTLMVIDTATGSITLTGSGWREIYNIRTTAVGGAIIIPIPSDVYKLHIEASFFTTVADTFVMGRISQDNGTTYLQAADQYRARYGGSNGAAWFASGDVTESYMRVGAAAGPTVPAITSIEIDLWNDLAASKGTTWRSEHSGFHSTQFNNVNLSSGYTRNQTGRPTHLMLYPLSGQIAAGSTVIVEGR